MSKIKVKNATKQGYVLVREGGVLDLSFPDSKTRRGRVIDEGETSPTLDTGCEVGVIFVGNIFGTDKEPNPSGGRVYHPQWPHENFRGGHGMSQPLIVDEDKKPIRGGRLQVRACLTPDRLEKRQNGRRFKEDGEEAFTLTSQDKHGVLLDDGREIRIRKLTPKECFRLQGWTDDYFEKAQQFNSDSQLYKQAGNGVTVNVIEAIARRFNDDTDQGHGDAGELHSMRV